MRDALTAESRPPSTEPAHPILRPAAAWLLVLAAFAVAVVGALQANSGGLAIAVSTLSGGATDTLKAVGQAVPFGYAFAIGMASAVNPCGFALLPTYMGLYLGTAAHDRGSWPALLRRALVVSATMTVSFVLLFGAAGLVLGAAGAIVGPLLPWLSIGVGVLLMLAAGSMLAGRTLTLAPAERLAGSMGPKASEVSVRGYAAYGVAFGLSSLGCTLPLFLTVLGSGLAQSRTGETFSSTVQGVLLYALGMGTVVFALTVLVALLGHGVLRHVRGIGRVLQPLGAVLLLATGGYIVYYWLSAGGILG